MMGEGILIAVAILYSSAVAAIGRRLPRPASLTAYGTALAVLVAVPLLPNPTAQLVDRVLSIAGTGRQQLAIGGSGLLTALFVMLWLYVHTLHLPDLAAVFYGLRAGHPSPVLWMNVVMGLGIVYIAAWGLIEFLMFLRGARSTYEQGVAGVVVVLYALSCAAGTLTIVEAVARHRGVDMAVVYQVKTPFSGLVLTATVVVLVGQIWLWPLWRHRRQLLVRYVEPELAQLRNDLLNLSAAEAELHLDIHHEAYANRAIVEDVAVRCRAAGFSPGRCAIARMAASLITFQRDNLIQDPSYGLVTSWDSLMEEAAAEIDRAMAATAWEKALRDAYVYQHVYILMFLVLDRRAFREILLLDARPRVQPWHHTVADLIATVMHEHGQSTPRYAAMTQRVAQRTRLARRGSWVSRQGGAGRGPDRPARDEAENPGSW